QRALATETAEDQEEDRELLERFNAWYAETLDLPGTYYLEVVNWIFRENRLAKGTFVALGQAVQLERLKIPVFLLAGAADEIVPAAQAMATARLLGAPAALIESASAPSSHLGLFMGGRTLTAYWPRIARWLQQGEGGLWAREVASP